MTLGNESVQYVISAAISLLYEVFFLRRAGKHRWLGHVSFLCLLFFSANEFFMSPRPWVRMACVVYVLGGIAAFAWSVRHPVKQ